VRTRSPVELRTFERAADRCAKDRWSAAIVDRVLPDVLVRQYVLSLPYEFTPEKARAARKKGGAAIRGGAGK
jgi:hypothetical protein